MSAPKSVAKRRKLEKKRKRKQQARQRRRRKQGGGPHFEPDVFPGPVDGVKMSDVLEEFVAPLDERIEDIEAFRRLLTLGVLAWNAALRPEAEERAMVDDVIGKGMRGEDPEVRAYARAVVDHLIERKKRYFARYRRPILHFEVSELDDGGWYLNVVSLVT